MCEFCLKHGEGKKWYLKAENYSEDLLSDVRRRKFIKEFFKDPVKMATEVDSLGKLSRSPAFVRAVTTRLITRRMKKIHYGQVVPIEDVERIFEMVNSIVRVACICRAGSIRQEKRYCYGVSMSPHGGAFAGLIGKVDESYKSGPDFTDQEELTREDALASLREHEREGLCHTVWTFRAPFIGGICNCDRTDCLAMRCTVTHNVPVMFRAEYIACVDPERCSGCRQCMRVCQFGAIGYSASNQKCAVDQQHCYGCGICRASCSKDAISLKDRAPAVAGVPAP